MANGSPSKFDTERNLLFGVLAMQMELIDVSQLGDAATEWIAAKQIPLADLLVARGWLTLADREDVERVLARKLKKHGGDARACLGAAADSGARKVLEHLNDPDVQRLMTDFFLPSTELYRPSSKYRLRHVHKEGGLGRVWLARDGDLNREVAVKEIKSQRSPPFEARNRFVKEAQITGQLEHPNIVPVYELGNWPETGEPFYVMKFVRGQTLGAAIAEYHRSYSGGAPDPQQRRHLLGTFVGICNAIAYAHARGVIHRDLKPANVVLGKFGEVILLDWGLAKVLDEPRTDEEISPVFLSSETKADVTSADDLIGTPGYMAPEQAARRLDLVDRATDVYGLGAILFEILTGKPPHEGAHTEAICWRIINFETPRSRAIHSLVPAGLDEICAKAMSKPKSDRYASATDLAEAVQRWLAEEPIASYRGIVEELEKLARRQPRVQDYQEQLARNRINLALVLAGMERNTEAEAVFRAAVSEYEALVADRAAEPRFRADLAAARLHLSRVLLALNRGDEAKSVQQAAAADYEQIVAANPGAHEYHSNLASVSLTLAPGALQLPPVAPADPTTLHEAPETPDSQVPVQEERAEEMHARFTLLKQHAAGGMSRIWLAHDHDLNRHVAIKEIHEAMMEDESMRKRFHREAQITAQLEHPYIVPVYGLGHRSQDNAPFLIMRLARGPTLREAIIDYHTRSPTLGNSSADLRKLLSAFACACRALAYAHRRGVIHRDPKPANILLSEEGGVIVVDWGLAKLADHPEEELPNQLGISSWADTGSTQTGTVMGTPAYMSPEQASGMAHQIDARSDIYVLGAGLFEILTGKPPYQGPTALETMMNIRDGPTPSARKVNSTVPHALDAVCAKAMAHSPADRYDDARDLGADVERWLAGESVSAYSGSWLGKLGRWLRFSGAKSRPQDLGA